MLTIENIKSNFSYIKAIFDNSESYHNTDNYFNLGDFTDIYFESINQNVKQEQIDIYNSFKLNHTKYLSEIEQYFIKNLNNYELNHIDKIKQKELFFDVIYIPNKNNNYDLALICSREYQKYFIFKKSISLRVEFKNNSISSVKRPQNITKENSINN